MNKLKAAIISAFGSQYSFSKRLNVREAQISRVLTGRNTLSPEEIYQWSRLLNCDVAAIITQAEKEAAERAAE